VSLRPTPGGSLDGSLKPGVLAKSEQGHLLHAGGEPASFKAETLFFDPDVSTADVFKIIVRSCVRHFRRNEAILIRTRGAEALHQSRVALRRLRTAFSLFKDVIADDEVEKLKRRMKLVSEKLGAARDLDVFLEKLANGGVDRASGDIDLLERSRKGREAAYGAAIEVLQRKQSQSLMFDVLAWSETGPWLGNGGAKGSREQPIAAFAAGVLERRTRQIRKAGRRLDELTPPARHDVRIEAKKLRYATEFFSSLALTKKKRRRHEAVSAALVELQEHLGTLNDLSIGDTLMKDATQRAEGSAGSKCPSTPQVAQLGRGRIARTSLKAARSAYREIAKAKPFWAAPSRGTRRRVEACAVTETAPGEPRQDTAFR
jgi:triphosphatase